MCAGKSSVTAFCGIKNCGKKTGFAPQYHPQYGALEACLKDIQQYLATRVPTNIRPCRWDVTDPAFLSLVELLKNVCFLPKVGSISIPSVQLALKQVQEMHGLPPTGVLDAATCTLLNGHPQIWVEKIQHALKKWSALGKLPAHCLVANIPAFTLDILDHGRSVLHSRVMMGKLNSPTPTFSGHIYSIIFNPTWIVPRTRYKDFMPLVNRDGFYVQKGCLFQRPGPKNHLGQIKFLTRRGDAIIFHSTHEPELFADDVRAYSLGCVRVQDFVGLAQNILTSCGVRTDVPLALKQKKSQDVRLKNPFPVYVVYQTLWVQRGTIGLYPDIYGFGPRSASKATNAVLKNAPMGIVAGEKKHGH